MAKWSALSDLQFGGPGFEPHPDHYSDLFLGSPEFISLAGKVIATKLHKGNDGRGNTPLTFHYA